MLLIARLLLLRPVYCIRSPLFVTWKKGVTPSSHHHLRGCIGTLEPKQLHKAIRDYTLTRHVLCADSL